MFQIMLMFDWFVACVLSKDKINITRNKLYKKHLCHLKKDSNKLCVLL